MNKKLIAVTLVSLFCAQTASSFAGESAANYANLCVSCHGKDMKGNPAMVKMFKTEPAAMDLTAIPAENDAAAIIAGGKGKMPAYKAKLTAEEITALAAYLKPAETKPAEAVAADAATAVAPAAGAKTGEISAPAKAAEVKEAVPAQPATKAAESADFKAKCVSCHGKDGKGNPAMVKMFKLEPAAMDLTGKAAQEKTDEALAKLITDGKGKMPSFKGKLSDLKVKELVKYLRTLAPQAKP